LKINGRADVKDVCDSFGVIELKHTGKDPNRHARF